MNQMQSSHQPITVKVTFPGTSGDTRLTDLIRAAGISRAVAGVVIDGIAPGLSGAGADRAAVAVTSPRPGASDVAGPTGARRPGIVSGDWTTHAKVIPAGEALEIPSWQVDSLGVRGVAGAVDVLLLVL